MMTVWSLGTTILASSGRIHASSCYPATKFETSTGSAVSEWPVLEGNFSSCVTLLHHGKYIASLQNAPSRFGTHRQTPSCEVYIQSRIVPISFQCHNCLITPHLPGTRHPDRRHARFVEAWSAREHGSIIHCSYTYVPELYTRQSRSRSGHVSNGEGITSIQLSGVQARRSRQHGHCNCGRASP